MDLLAHIMIIISGVCLTLAVINLRFWLNARSHWEYFSVACACASVGVYSWFEVALIGTASPATFGAIMRWGSVPATLAVISIAWFAYVHLRSERRWLFWSIIGFRSLGLALNFIFTPNIYFREITAISQFSVFGQHFSAPVGVPNQWVWVNHLSIVLLIVFTVDAAISKWRLGERRDALIFGGGIVSFSVIALALTVLAVWSSTGTPLVATYSFLFIVGSMAYGLNYDLNRSTRLAGELSITEQNLNESLQDLRLSAAAGNVGTWSMRFGDATILASEKWLELYEIEQGQSIEFGDFIQRIHPDDRERTSSELKAVEDGRSEYEAEHRILLRNGGTRWIRSSGRPEAADGEPKMMRGAAVDVTRETLAKTEAHELSQKLINAQEKERARLARELHDDFSQSLAMLSIQLGILGNETHEPGSIRMHVDKLMSQIQLLSTDVHRISHELHPSKLVQLGLESALRGFCREFASANRLKIQFEAGNLPRLLPDDISLCLYRCAQESLQNVAKHSGASIVDVFITVRDRQIWLEVSDNGSGFDKNAAVSKQSLGLTSLHERLVAVNGTLKVDPTIGAGTKVTARVPYYVEQ